MRAHGARLGLVHGLASLAIGGSLHGILERANTPGLSLEQLVSAALRV